MKLKKRKSLFLVMIWMMVNKLTSARVQEWIAGAILFSYSSNEQNTYRRRNSPMSEHKNDSFRDLNIKAKIATVVGIALLILLGAGFVLGLYFFGLVGVFELLGVQYISIGSLVVFVVSFFILGVIVELFSKVIFKMSIRSITGKIKVFFIRISFEATSNWLVLFTVDEFMKNITLSLKAEIIIALLIAVLEIVFDDDKN